MDELMGTMKLRSTAAVIATAALMIAGCGGSDTPSDVVEDIFAAAGDEDYAGVCDLLTEEAIQESIEDTGSETCEEAQEAETADLPDDFFETAEVGEATEDGD